MDIPKVITFTDVSKSDISNLHHIFDCLANIVGYITFEKVCLWKKQLIYEYHNYTNPITIVFRGMDTHILIKILDYPDPYMNSSLRLRIKEKLGLT